MKPEEVDELVDALPTIPIEILPEEADVYVGCMRVEDAAFRVPRGVIMSCSMCGKDCIAAPSTVAMLEARPSARIVCIQDLTKMADAKAEKGEPGTFALAPGARKEYHDYTRYRNLQIANMKKDNAKARARKNRKGEQPRTNQN